MEKRLLLAFVLSVAIFAVWTSLFPPPQPPVPETVDVEPEPPVTPTATPGGSTERPAAEQEEAVAVADVVERVEALAEERVRLSSDSARFEFSNRGAAVTSVILNEYRDDDGGPLDLIQTVEHAQRTLPLQLVDDRGPDTRLYAIERVGGGYRFRWSDGLGTSVEKTVALSPHGFGLEVQVAAQGDLAAARLGIGTGMRDTGPTERANRFSAWGDITVAVGGEVEKLRREKVKEAKTFDGRGLLFAGFSDTYFLNLWRPSVEAAAVVVVPLEVNEVNDDGENEPLPVLQLTIEQKGGGFAGELFTAPKEYDLLRAVGGGVEETLRFGFFHPISVFFLKALRWIYGAVGNYGLAIILLTLGIRIVLFPLMHTSTVSMRKMQKLQPKVKAIQEKYKKNKSDPQVRAKMNQEMMQLYKLEGVNPMGGCLPILVQLPILWALYTLFAYAIELRHAPFMLWIVDLSAKDPLYVTPVLMTATMWLQQKMAPQAGDPQQQRIMRMMPLIFGIMFLGFPSGLVLYWLSNNVITILQQEVTFRLMGERRGRGGGQRTGKGKGK